MKITPFHLKYLKIGEVPVQKVEVQDEWYLLFLFLVGKVP